MRTKPFGRSCVKEPDGLALARRSHLFILRVSGGQLGVIPVLVTQEACGLPLDTINILGWVLLSVLPSC